MTNPAGQTSIPVAQDTRVNPGCESGPALEDAASQCWDAVVMGAGPGGLAAAIHLRRGGLRVLCIEPDEFPHDRVGESLDWSAPATLAQLGISVESLIEDQVAVYKKHIEIVTPDRPTYQAQPEAWFAQPSVGIRNRHSARGQKSPGPAPFRNGPRIGCGVLVGTGYRN
jgi:hypothetical protein